MDLVKLRERERVGEERAKEERGRCLLECVRGGDWRRAEQQAGR